MEMAGSLRLSAFFFASIIPPNPRDDLREELAGVSFYQEDRVRRSMFKVVLSKDSIGTGTRAPLASSQCAGRQVTLLSLSPRGIRGGRKDP